MNLKAYTGKTQAQIRTMSVAEYNAMQEQLEDDNHHTAVVMVLAARNNCGRILKCLEALDDLHIAYGSMPYAAIELREALKRLTDYQQELAALRAENALFRRLLERALVQSAIVRPDFSDAIRAALAAQGAR